ncbi:MAG TPA: squalene/phytoene synthase family protein [Steroidobacteraceae bacterium]|nr:squalene/phytoene synthase family protein [Steroidobacteraceae bacterium]
MRTDPARDGPAPGSLRYYSVLFAPDDRRPLLESLYGFEHAVAEASALANHEAAHARLQWWRGEIDRLVAGRPEHPVAAGLLPLRTSRGADLGLLHEVLAAADLDLARFAYENWRELEAYCFRAAGALQTLIAAALAGEREPSVAERDFARALGSSVRQTEMLCDLAGDLARGRLYVPTSALESAGLDAAGVRDEPDSPALLALLEGWRARLDQELATLPERLAPAERRTQRPGLVLAALHRRLLERTVAPASGANTPPSLGPWKRLWTAWRTAVRYA